MPADAPHPPPVARRAVLTFAALLTASIAAGNGWLPPPSDAGRLAAAAVVGVSGATLAQLTGAPRCAGALLAGVALAAAAPAAVTFTPRSPWLDVARAAAAAPAAARAGVAALVARHAAAAARRARGLEEVTQSLYLLTVATAAWAVPLAAEAAAGAAALGGTLVRGGVALRPLPIVALAATGAALAAPASGVGGDWAAGRGAAAALAVAAVAGVSGDPRAGLVSVAGAVGRAAVLVPALGLVVGALVGATAAGGWTRPPVAGGLLLTLTVAAAALLAAFHHADAGLLAALVAGAAASEVWLRAVDDAAADAAAEAAKCGECGALRDAPAATACAECGTPLAPPPTVPGTDPAALEAAKDALSAAWTSIAAPLLYSLAGGALAPRALTRVEAAAGVAAAAAVLTVRVVSGGALAWRSAGVGAPTARARWARRAAAALRATRKGDNAAALSSVVFVVGTPPAAAAAAAACCPVSASHVLDWGARVVTVRVGGLPHSDSLPTLSKHSSSTALEMMSTAPWAATAGAGATSSPPRERSPLGRKPADSAALLPRDRSIGVAPPPGAVWPPPATETYAGLAGGAAGPQPPDSGLPEIPGWSVPSLRTLDPSSSAGGSGAFSDVSLSTTPSAASLPSTPGGRGKGRF